MDSWIVPAWSLKNKEVFWIGLVDGPCVEPWKCGVFPDWTHELSPRGDVKTKKCSGLASWIVPVWSPRNKEVFQIGIADCPRVMFWIGPA